MEINRIIILSDEELTILAEEFRWKTDEDNGVVRNIARKLCDAADIEYYE